MEPDREECVCPRGSPVGARESRQTTPLGLSSTRPELVPSTDHGQRSDQRDGQGLSSVRERGLPTVKDVRAR